MRGGGLAGVGFKTVGGGVRLPTHPATADRWWSMNSGKGVSRFINAHACCIDVRASQLALSKRSNASALRPVAQSCGRFVHGAGEFDELVKETESQAVTCD